MAFSGSQYSGYLSASDDPVDDSFDESLRNIKRPYGICLVGVEDNLRKLILDLVPTVDHFTFSSPGFSHHEFETHSEKLLGELQQFYEERKEEMKRLIVIGFGFGGMLLKQALIMASRIPAYKELSIVTSHLIFVLTPHQFDQSQAGFEKIVFEMIPSLAVISEPSLQRMATYFTSISTTFHSIARRYDIKNLLFFQEELPRSAWILDENLGTNVQLETRMSSDSLLENMNDLTKIYDCLAPLNLLDNDTLFEIPEYIKCLERLAWSWRPTTESPNRNEDVLAESDIKSKITPQLKLHEQESGRYPASTCLFGPTGFGKTTFLRSLCHELEGYKNILPVIFEKRNFQATAPSTVDILKSFIHQVLSQVPATFSSISHFYDNFGRQDIWTEQLLWSIVRKLINRTRSHKLILFIDGTGDWLSLFKGLFTVAFEETKHPSVYGVQAIYTATEDKPNLIAGSSLGIHIPTEVKPPELLRILKKDLIEDQSVREIFEKAIANEIPSALEDFLTTSLYLKRYSRLPMVSSASILRRMLPKLPHERDQIYQAEMDLLVSKDKNIQKWCWSSLSWLVRAIRPLTIQELSTAVALHQIGADISQVQIKNNLSIKMWDDLDSHLGLFVQNDGQRLDVVHGTAKAFIRSYNNTSNEEGCRLASHADIVTLCLRYLEMPAAKSNESTADDGPQYDFRQYSIENWPRHYSLAVEDDDGDQEKLVEHILEFFSPNNAAEWKSWFRAYQTTTSRLISVEAVEAHPFQVACGLGQYDIVSRMLKEKDRYTVNDDVLNASLDIAIKNTQSTMVPLLLEAGSRSELAICYAAERNLVDLIDQLVEKERGLDVIERAIKAAATQGSLQAFEKICSQVENPKDLVRIRNEALELAVTGGHKLVVSALLQPKETVRMTTPTTNNSEDTTPTSGSESAEPMEVSTSQYTSAALRTAVESGDLNIVSLLINAGAQVTESVLEYSSKQPNIKVVQRVIQELRTQNSIHKTSKALHFASERGYEDIVEELLNYGIAVDCRDVDGQTPLHKAAKRGHGKIVQLLLARDANKHVRDDEADMPCHLAAQQGHVEIHKALQDEPGTRSDDLQVLYAVKGGHLLMVKYLLPLKLSTVSTEDQSILNTALLEATSRGFRSIVRALCEEGLVLKSRTGTTSPLHNAAAGGYEDIVDDLITKGAEVNARDEAKRTPLHRSVSFSKVVEVLLKRGANPNIFDLDGKSPLHFAASLTQAQQAEEVVRLLLAYGADPKVKDEKRMTPLLLAARNTHFNVVELLLRGDDRDVDVNVTDSSKRSPLHYAANLVESTEAEKYVGMLLDFNADTNVQDNKGNTPLHLAAARKHYKAIEMLLRAGAKPDILNSIKESPLHLVVQVGTRVAHEEEEEVESSVQILLRHGAKANAQDKVGTTPLHWAAGSGLTRVMKALLNSLEGGEGVDLEGKFERTPLSEAVVGNHLEMVKLLLAHGADINSQGSSKKLTPLYRASQRELPDIVRFLLEKGADHSLTSTNGWTPLATAAEYGQTTIVKILLENGADVNHQSNSGYTPLHSASRKGRVEVVEVLLSYNADTSIKTRRLGQTARDVASNEKIIEMIDKARSSQPCATELTRADTEGSDDE